MKKKFLFFGALLGAFCFVVACGTKTGEYHNKEKTYSIQFPSNWEVKENPMKGTDVVALSPLENSVDQFSENISVGTEEFPQAVTLNDAYQMEKAGLQKNSPGFQILEEGEANLNTQPARWILYTTAPSSGEGAHHQLIQYFVVKGSRVYIITSIGMLDSFDRYRKQFEESTKTFRLE